MFAKFMKTIANKTKIAPKTIITNFRVALRFDILHINSTAQYQSFYVCYQKLTVPTSIFIQNSVLGVKVRQMNQ